jgi:serine/threonine protein kinase
MMHPLSRHLCKPVRGQRFIFEDDEYELGGKLGDGAAGLVQKARRVRDRVPRAVKFLAPDPKYIDPAVFDDVAARFRREGQRAPFLNHPCLVRIYAYIENRNGEAFLSKGPKNPFILMDAIRGKTLEDWIRRRSARHDQRGDLHAFTIDSERLSIAACIASALAYLHSKKLIHRDVKPANIFLPSDGIHSGQREALLGDFGVMKWGDFQASLSSGTLTVTAQRGLGTLKYMSPEQAVRPKEVTTRSDIFSFGITLFELFTEQILISPHHVFEIHAARMLRDTTIGRFASMGYHINPPDAILGELVLDMLLRGIKSRPSIDKIRGRLCFAYEKISGRQWDGW